MTTLPMACPVTLSTTLNVTDPLYVPALTFERSAWTFREAEEVKVPSGEPLNHALLLELVQLKACAQSPAAEMGTFAATALL